MLDKLQDQLKTSLKAKDELRTSVLRMLISDFRYAQIEKRGPLDENESMQVSKRKNKINRRERKERKEKNFSLCALCALCGSNSDDLQADFTFARAIELSKHDTLPFAQRRLPVLNHHRL